MSALDLEGWALTWSCDQTVAPPGMSAFDPTISPLKHLSFWKLYIFLVSTSHCVCAKCFYGNSGGKA